jgi:uncharacterized protein YegP (UPF0339 family)
MVDTHLGENKMKNPKFQIFAGKGGQYYFRLRAGNGEPILGSEGYSSKSGAKNGIESVKSNASNDSRYERKVAKNGQFFFNLEAANHEVIGKSEMYKSKRSRDHGISVIKRIARTAPTDDTTD